jgi:hypothetical protein
MLLSRKRADRVKKNISSRSLVTEMEISMDNYLQPESDIQQSDSYMELTTPKLEAEKIRREQRNNGIRQNISQSRLPKTVSEHTIPHNYSQTTLTRYLFS